MGGTVMLWRTKCGSAATGPSPARLPKIGPAKANRYLTHYRIAPSKTVGGLSERQRHELTGSSTAERGDDRLSGAKLGSRRLIRPI